MDQFGWRPAPRIPSGKLAVPRFGGARSTAGSALKIPDQWHQEAGLRRNAGAVFLPVVRDAMTFDEGGETLTSEKPIDLPAKTDGRVPAAVAPSPRITVHPRFRSGSALPPPGMDFSAVNQQPSTSAWNYHMPWSSFGGPVTAASNRRFHLRPQDHEGACRIRLDTARTLGNRSVIPILRVPGTRLRPDQGEQCLRIRQTIKLREAN